MTSGALVVTHMVKLGMVEACNNQVSGHKSGIAGIYNRATYREPKRVALQAWADWLEALVERPGAEQQRCGAAGLTDCGAAG